MESLELVKRAIDLVSLNDFLKFKPKKLSGGLLRRLNIACGIAHRPEIIILDEPTVAVDPQSRNSILEGIKKLNDEGSTIIYTSHYMDEVDFLCDDIVIIDKGKVIAKGTSELLDDNGIRYSSLNVEKPSLNDVFLELTGKDLRD